MTHDEALRIFFQCCGTALQSAQEILKNKRLLKRLAKKIDYCDGGPGPGSEELLAQALHIIVRAGIAA